MSKKHHGGRAPVPPGNRPEGAPANSGDELAIDTDIGESFQEQDPKRRLGGYNTAGEHSRVQPGPLNDGGSTHK